MSINRFMETSSIMETDIIREKKKIKLKLNEMKRFPLNLNWMNPWIQIFGGNSFQK